MRTTLNLDDHLMQRLKQQANARGVTLTRQIEETLARGLISGGREPNGSHEFRPFASGAATPIDVADRDAIEAAIGAVP